MIIRVSEETLAAAAQIHALSWQDSSACIPWRVKGNIRHRKCRPGNSFIC